MENQAEIERIKREDLNKLKEALQKMKSENKSKMLDLLDKVRRSTDELARIKDLHFKDKKEYTELFDASSNKINEKIEATFLAQSKEFKEERKTHKIEIKELERKLKSAQLENGKLQENICGRNLLFRACATSLQMSRSRTRVAAKILQRICASDSP